MKRSMTPERRAFALWKASKGITTNADACSVLGIDPHHIGYLLDHGQTDLEKIRVAAAAAKTME